MKSSMIIIFIIGIIAKNLARSIFFWYAFNHFIIKTNYLPFTTVLSVSLFFQMLIENYFNFKKLNQRIEYTRLLELQKEQEAKKKEPINDRIMSAILEQNEKL